MYVRALSDEERTRLEAALRSSRAFTLRRAQIVLASARKESPARIAASLVCFEQGITPRQMSIEAIRRALKSLGTSWKRAKHWITSPDPLYALKKSSGTA